MELLKRHLVREDKSELVWLTTPVDISFVDCLHLVHRKALGDELGRQELREVRGSHAQLAFARVP